MGKTDLIKTVRGLDQNGAGENGENLEILWKCLAESSDGQFHAAEECALRWLLKSMNGSSQDAETIRRYPLTWTILDCVFQRIPLFSLAKSLADRKFVAVLQNTLKDISKPTQEFSSSSSKRKRSPVIHYELEDLKNPNSCLATAQVVLSILQSLLNRLDLKAAGSRDRIGAEHIRSLFCTSAAEATTIPSLTLTICGLLLNSDVCDEIEGRENWIRTTSALWDLHLQGADDTLEVAIHLFKPTVAILSSLEAFPQTQRKDISETLVARWSADLQRFMHRNLILPARAAFLRQQGFEAIRRALDVSDDATTRVAGPLLYFLAAGASGLLAERDMRKNSMLWMNQVFRAVEARIRQQPDRILLMEYILRQAVQKSIPVDVEELRRVCRDYGLGDGQTDWSLISNTAICNPDVFHLSEVGIDLLNEICARSVSQEATDSDLKAQSDLIGAIRQGFRIRRDFSGFLRLWFKQLCSIEQRGSAPHSPWFKIGRKEHKNDSLSSLIELELSSQQLLGVIRWVEEQEPHAYPQALCLFVTSIAQGIHSDPFIDAIGMRLFDLISKVTYLSSSTALKWRVVATTMSWVSQIERGKIWTQVKEKLSKLLRKASISSAETFEAFKCCYQTWDLISGIDELVGEPAKLVEKFSARLVEELESQDVLEITKLSSCLEFEENEEFQEEIALQQYMAWYIAGSSRFCRLYSRSKGKLSSPLEIAVSTKKASTSGLHTLWDALLRNDVSLNDTKLSRNLVDRLITALCESEKDKGWPGEQGRMWIGVLSSMPLEAFGRTQREQIMIILDRSRAKMVKSPKRVSLEGWKSVLDLITKVMSRPTFYEGMRFSNLVEMADAMSGLSLEEPMAGETLLELIERFFSMASTTIRQMTENNEERSILYLTESSIFVTECGNKVSQKSLRLPPFRITLLKALVVELSWSTTFQDHPDLGKLPQNAKKVLAERITSVLGDFMADKKLLSKNEVATDLTLFATVNAAPVVDAIVGLSGHKSSAVRKLEQRSKEAMKSGDLRGWKIQVFLHTHLEKELEIPRPTRFTSLSSVPLKSRQPLLEDYVASITTNMNMSSIAQYLEELISEYTGGCDTDGQILAIQHVVSQLIERTDLHGKGEGVDLAAAHGELTLSLLKKRTHCAYTCRILHALLEKKPQAMGQWNIEITLSTVCDLTSPTTTDTPAVPFTWLCKLIGTIIKKHRLRLEGHYHLLLITMQALLHNLISQQPANAGDGVTQESMAHFYGRLITLICEPSAGAVSRSQYQSALDSATDAAKRSAGRQMYLVLMQYVKLQLEANVSREVREALEPTMNTIFDITPPETRKILNDAMDGSGRAILREMFKRYVKFGKWGGV